MLLPKSCRTCLINLIYLRRHWTSQRIIAEERHSFVLKNLKKCVSFPLTPRKIYLQTKTPYRRSFPLSKTSFVERKKAAAQRLLYLTEQKSAFSLSLDTFRRLRKTEPSGKKFAIDRYETTLDTSMAFFCFPLRDLYTSAPIAPRQAALYTYRSFSQLWTVVTAVTESEDRLCTRMRLACSTQEATKHRSSGRNARGKFEAFIDGKSLAREVHAVNPRSFDRNK